MSIVHAYSNLAADFTGTITGFNSQGSTTTIAATDLVRPSDWNSGHNVVVTLVGNTNNASTVSGTNIVLSGGAGITMVGSNSVIGIVAASGTLSGIPLYPYGGNLPFAQSSISLGQNSLYLYPVHIDSYLTMDHIRMPVMLTNSSSAASSGQKGQTYRVGIYSRAASNNTVVTQLYSTSYTVAASYSSNASFAHSAISALGNSTSYNSYTSSSAGLNLSSILHGPRELIIPASTLLPPGEYWFAVLASTSAAGTNGNVLNLSNLAVAYQTFNRVGQATNASNSGFHQFMMHGTYSTTTAGLPNAISATQIRQLGTMPILFAATGTV